MDPDKITDYFNVVDSVTGTGYKVCAALESNSQRVCNTPANNCYCRVSAQGTIPTGIPPANLTGTNTSYGMGGSQSQSCDPNGTLLSGLVGYWKMDEGTGTTASDSSGNGNSGASVNGATWASWKFNFAGSFNGVNSYYDISNYSSLATAMQNHFTYSVWVKYNGPSSTNQCHF